MLKISHYSQIGEADLLMKVLVSLIKHADIYGGGCNWYRYGMGILREKEGKA